MITYFKMKYAEWKVKAMFYSTIAGIIDNHKDIIELIQNIYDSLKDVPADELRSELISKVADFAHSQTAKEQEV